MQFLIPPWKHQLEAIARASAQDSFGFLFEMGTGKTGTLINTLRVKYTEHKRILRTCILCPSIVVENWLAEFQKHSKIPREKILLLMGTPAQRKRAFEEMERANPMGFIVVTNYDKLVSNERDDRTGKLTNKSDVLAMLRRWDVQVLVLDESHKCKDITSHRTKAVLALSEPSQNPAILYKYILTGTPVLRDPTDLFSQFLILDGGQTFGREFFRFKLTCMEDKNAKWKGKPNYFPKWEVRAGALEEVNRKIQARSMHVRKEECLDLPPLVRKRVYVDMSPEQRRLYLEMKNDLITFLNDKACVANLALTKALRLLQIASGYVQFEDGSKAKIKDTPKQQALRELLEELTPNHKVLVWSVFKENYAQVRKVCEELGVEAVEVHGEVSDKEKFANVERFNTDPRVRVFIGHPGSGGIGINLVQASYAIFFSRGFSYGDDAQAEARNYRGGSEIHEKVTRIDLIARHTLDESVLQRLEAKQEISDKVLRDLIAEF